MSGEFRYLLDHWDSLLAFLGVLGGAVYFGKRLGEIRANLLQALQSIRALMVSNSFLLGALVKKKIISADKLLDVVNPYRELSQSAIDTLITKLNPSGNPITSQEKDSYIRLAQKAQKEKSLEYKEAVEFYNLAQKVVGEYPNDSTYQQVLDYAAFILGQAAVPA